MTAIRGPVLVSGFGPWGRLDENPTALVLDALAALERPDLRTLLLPVDSAPLAERVDAAIERVRPRLWIGLGLAVGASVIAVERQAANVLHFSEPDMAGAQRRHAPVVPGGPASHEATWPVAELVAKLRQDGVPARASADAGTFLCNQLFYTVLHAAARRGGAPRAGFLHVPAHPALVARAEGDMALHPSMAVETVTRAVLLAASLAG